MSAMSFHAIDPLATAAFGMACFAAGGLAAFVALLVVLRHQGPSSPPPAIATALDDRLAEAAERWAAGRGTPGLANWAHHRLCSFIEAGQRRSDAPRKSWRARP